MAWIKAPNGMPLNLSVVSTFSVETVRYDEDKCKLLAHVGSSAECIMEGSLRSIEEWLALLWELLPQTKVEEWRKRYGDACQEVQELNLICSNQEQTAKVLMEAIRRMLKHPARATEVAQAANCYHPMHEDSWKGWPEDTD